MLTYRLLNKFNSTGLLDGRNYGKIMSILRRAKKVRVGESGWRLIKMNPSHMKLLGVLSLIEPPAVPIRRPVGRPPKTRV